MHLVHYGNMGCQVFKRGIQNLKKRPTISTFKKYKLYLVNRQSADLLKSTKIWPSKLIFYGKNYLGFSRKHYWQSMLPYGL